MLVGRRHSDAIYGVLIGEMLYVRLSIRHVFGVRARQQ